MTIFKHEMTEEELKARLVKLGLSRYEAIAYITLLREGQLTAGELVKKSGIPHSRVYDIARKLSEKGLIEVIESRPMRLKPVNPAVALKAFVERAKRALDAECDRALSLIGVICVGWPSEKTTWVLETEFIDIVRPVLRMSKHQLFLGSEPYVVSRLVDEIEWASTRGVNTTVVCYGNVKGASFIERLADAGAEVYVRKASSLSIVLADLSAGAISAPNIGYTILTSEPVLVRALMDMFFSSIVKTSTPVSRPPRLKGSYVLLWSIIDRLPLGVRLRVHGIDLRSGKRVVVEGSVEEKVVDDGIVSVVLRTKGGRLRVGGIGAKLEDVEGLVFEVLEER